MNWATTKRIGAFLTDLIFPRTCAICRVRLGEREHCVCMECATKLPRHTPAFVHAEERLLGSPLIRSLSSPFIYQHANPTYDLIIALKYRGYGEVADFVVRTPSPKGNLHPSQATSTSSSPSRSKARASKPVATIRPPSSAKPSHGTTASPARKATSYAIEAVTHRRRWTVTHAVRMLKQPSTSPTRRSAFRSYGASVSYSSMIC